jgi:hypothetical protein
MRADLAWMRGEPILHVHLSGSAGSSMCKLAHRLDGYNAAPGITLGCNAPGAGPTAWKGRAQCDAASFSSESAAARWWPEPNRSCAQIRDRYRYPAEGRWHTYGFSGYETFLPEQRGPSAAIVAATTAAVAARRLNGTNCAKQRYSSPTFMWGRDESAKRPHHAFEVPRGAPLTPLEASLGVTSVGEAPAPGETLCPGFRYSFLMNDPIRRIATQLMLHSKAAYLECPSGRSPAESIECTAQGRVAWAARALERIYAADLLLDERDGIGFMGTPSASNAYIRFLLGRRVWLSRLGGVTRRHLDAAKAVLSRFAFVAPVARLNASAPLLSARLNWTQCGNQKSPCAQTLRTHVFVTTSARVKHETYSVYARELVRRHGELLRAHNALDMELYEWVRAKFEADLRRVTEGVVAPDADDREGD